MSGAGFGGWVERGHCSVVSTGPRSGLRQRYATRLVSFHGGRWGIDLAGGSSKVASVNGELSIIVPSLNDARIGHAIASIRRFDDVEAARLIVVDGGSSPEVLNLIRAQLRSRDTLISERDDGVFDALNKGLDAVQTRYVGWLGGDDLFTGEVRSSDVLEALTDADLYIGCLGFVGSGRLCRVTYSWPAARGLAPIGLHNPHFATFGRAELLKRERFDIAEPAADAGYFLRIFDKRPRVATTDRIITYQRLGGASNGSLLRVLRMNHSVFRTYRRRSNAVLAALAVTVKVGAKVASAVQCRIRPTRVRL